MTETRTVQTNGVGLLGWLFLIMFVLKLDPGNHLSSPVEGWSWWVIWAPIWVPLAILAVVGVIAGIIWVIVAGTEQLRRKRRLKKSRAAMLTRHPGNPSGL